ncbi:unnamed protein product [Schistocephalus solidus]|uniref:ShKT domain-containing protein n=1 Tax=Schistocephalus solidus TaxID=70667 RepID=A0A183S8E7_SCHSO|nr:unnamed protein product [Schistocephalus solidus]
MRDKCAKSCGQCTEESTDACRDSYILPENCKAWAEIGECTKNPIWMAWNCAALPCKISTKHMRIYLMQLCRH